MTNLANLDDKTRADVLAVLVATDRATPEQRAAFDAAGKPSSDRSSLALT